MNDLVEIGFIVIACIVSMLALGFTLRVMLAVNKLRNDQHDIKSLLKRILELQKRTITATNTPTRRKEDSELNQASPINA